MRKILVFQHVASEPLGHLDPLLRESGFRIRYVNFGREPHAEPEVNRYDGLVVLGGPMNVGEEDRHPHLRTEVEAIRAAVAGGRPVLGICLGAQLLAAAMGAEVRPNPVPEIGWYHLQALPPAREDRLFRHFERPAHYVFQWHAYTCALPPGAVHLAATRHCRNQAFRIGDHAWGLQFHLEADAQLIERWLASAGGRREIETHWGPHRIPRIRTATRNHMQQSQPLSDRVFGEFVGLLGPRRRQRMLSSR